ncbi:MAG: YqgE/AlgH family protein, partial [Hyphomicrobiaceae bacterium]
MNARTKSASTTGDRYLDGQLLLAMPTMTDKRFRRAVIYMCRHSDEGAMGIIVNQRAKSLSLPTLLMQIGIVDEVDEAMADRLGERTVHVGGPVSGERGFVLHTSDYTVDDATLPIADG